MPNITGVEFVKGYFQETCNEALGKRVGRVAFAHLNADLYSSTLCALHWLTPLLGTGSILQFDEFIGGGRAEARAFEEWRTKSGIELLRVAEVDRDPSGHGNLIDRRLVFQVVSHQEMPPWSGGFDSLIRTGLRAWLGDNGFIALKKLLRR